MDSFSRHISQIPILSANPENTVSIKVPRQSLQAAHDNGLVKTGLVSRTLSYLPIRKRVSVEASVQGTNDSIFFAPETANADETNSRVVPAEFIKIRPQDHSDVVHMGDDFEIEFIGMSVTPQDMFGGNDLLLCSLTRNDEAGGETQSNSFPPTNKQSPSTPTSSSPSESGSSHNEEDATSADSSVDQANYADKAVKASFPSGDDAGMKELPTSLRLTHHDQPFIHYDPVMDGHDVGSKPDTFVPVPGSKRLYLQRKGRLAKSDDGESPTMYVRFTIMEVDKLSEEQLSAIKSIEMIAKSVSNAASSVPYLKIVSWMLKFANFLGKSALKKVSTPDHVMSCDIAFKITQPERMEPTVEAERRPRQEEYGNYLRYGYYFFLGRKVDARLYAQTGASTQSATLLLKRHGYNPNFAFSNEKEYFALTGVSYVVVKVTRGCSPVRTDRREVAEQHRLRLVKLLEKYKASDEQQGGGKKGSGSIEVAKEAPKVGKPKIQPSTLSGPGPALPGTAMM